MNVAAELGGCDGIGINPASQAGKLDGVIHPAISAPYFQARQLDDVFEVLGSDIGRVFGHDLLCVVRQV